MFGCVGVGNGDTSRYWLVHSPDSGLVNSSFHGALDAPLRTVTPRELENKRWVKALGTVGN